MLAEDYKKDIAIRIQQQIAELRLREKRTSKGEPMSLAAIGRTLDPPVSRVAVNLVMKGRAESERIKRAIERELGRPFWPRRKENRCGASR
jgi:hypothetical protein